MTQAAFNSFFKSPQKASGEVEQIAEGSVADATDVVAEGSVAAASDVVVVGSVADSMLEEGLSEVKSIGSNGDDLGVKKQSADFDVKKQGESGSTQPSDASPEQQIVETENAPPTMVPENFVAGDGDDGAGGHAFSVEGAIRAVDDGTCSAWMSGNVGKPLTESNLHAFATNIGQTAQQSATTNKESRFDCLSDADRKQATLLSDMLETSKFETKSYIGNKFRTECGKNKELGEKYKGMKTRDEQQTFRLDWAKLQLKEIVEKKVHKQSWSRVDRTKGRYRPFGRLVIDFGGWSDLMAIKGATTAATKCLAMGDPWVRIHAQSELAEFLVLEMEWEEEFGESWDHFRAHFTKGSNEKSDKLVGGEGQAAGDDDKAKEKAKEKEDNEKDKGKNKEKDKDKDDSPNEDADAKKKLANLIREAAKLKASFQAASSRFVELHSAIQTSPEWGWTKGGSQEAKLKEAHKNVKESLNEWHGEYLMASDFSQLKKKYTGERIQVELTSFLKIKGLVDNLAKLVGNMFRAHAELGS